MSGCRSEHPRAGVAAGQCAGVALLGFLAHATYLRAVSRQSLAAESDVSGRRHPATVRLEIAEDWLNTIGRYAGMLIGALVLIEAVFKRPGIGRILRRRTPERRCRLRSVALFYPDRPVLRADRPVRRLAWSSCGRAWTVGGQRCPTVSWPMVRPAPSPATLPPEPRWLAVLTVALGGLILIVLADADDQPRAARRTAAPADATLLPPGCGRSRVRHGQPGARHPDTHRGGHPREPVAALLAGVHRHTSRCRLAWRGRGSAEWIEGRSGYGPRRRC